MRFTKWILERFEVAPSLVGDLLEERVEGRSWIWYQWQVLSAILVHIRRNLRAYPLPALRSVLLTWTAMVGVVESTRMLYVWVAERWVNALVPFSGLFFEFWHPFSGGLCLVWCLGSAVVAVLIVRRSGNARMTMVIASAVAQVPVAVWWSRFAWLHPERVIGATARLWLPYFLNGAIILVGMPLCAFLGGLFGTSRSERSIT